MDEIIQYYINQNIIQRNIETESKDFESNFQHVRWILCIGFIGSNTVKYHSARLYFHWKAPKQTT